jgi:hypothetical protein
VSITAPSATTLPATALAATALPATGVPAIDPATEPAAVRQGGKAAKNAYETGLAFEQMLVSELAQTMTDTVSGSDPSDGDSGGDSSGGSSGGDSMGGSTSALGPFASMMPQAMSSSIMSDGGTGVAMQIAESIDPRLDAPPHGR